jgi:hypothetical protein
MRPLERGLYNLALAVHKTFNELLDTMTPSEYAGWIVYFEEREVERQRAGNGVQDLSDPQAQQLLIAQVHAAGGGKPRKRPGGNGHG